MEEGGERREEGDVRRMLRSSRGLSGMPLRAFGSEDDERMTMADDDG